VTTEGRQGTPLPLAALRDFFTRRSDIRLAYLFGSQVSGHTGPMSDYDIAVLPRVPYRYAQRFHLEVELARLLDTAHVDVVVLSKAPIELQYNVIALGVCVFEESKVTRVDYEAYVLGRYGDYLPVWRRQRYEILHEDERVRQRRIQRSREALRKTERVLKELSASQGKKL